MPDRTKVLVAEPDRDLSMSLANAIRQQGWEPLAASDGTVALSTAVKIRPDCIVIGARLPGGLEALKRMRHSVHTAIAPAIVLGVAGAAQTQQWLNSGAQAVLDKADAPSVCAAVRKLIPSQAMHVNAPDEALRSAARQAARNASGLLDTAPERAFDFVTRLVTRLLGSPTALLSLVDKDRQFFKSQLGLADPWSGKRQTPLTHSFCQWVVAGREKMAIADAREHPLLKSNLAIKDLGVIAYAGMPVHGASGEPLGSLCAIEPKPRDWSEQDLQTLQDLARMVEGCVAHNEIARQTPSQPADFDRFVGAAGAAVDAATSILRRRGKELGEERELLLDMIEQYSHDLVQLNRMIQVSKALH
jgi:GAF domain-containing protein